MTTLPLTERSSQPTESAAGTGEFRSSAAFPLPRLRPVADFVALPSTKRYVTVQGKFALAMGIAGAWIVAALVAAWFAMPSLADAVSWPLAVVLFAGVVLVPGFLVMFGLAGFLLDQPPTPTVAHPTLPITIAVTARNQARSVVNTLAYLRSQDYGGATSVILVDNGSTDSTVDEARWAAAQLELDLKVVVERRAGVVHARNAALACAETDLLVVVDAGTMLHPSAVRLLVARLLRSPSDTAAVSAQALVRNANSGDLSEAVAHDYSVNVHANHRLHGLFQAPLVAEASCSLYRTDALRTVGGWTRDDDDGVIVTWRFLERGWRVFHEPLAVAFATEPVGLGSWAARRIRAARSILEGARANGVTSLRFPFNRFVALVDAAAPIVDSVFAVGLGLAVLMAAFGSPALLLAYVLLVLPCSAASVVVVRRGLRHVLDDVGLAIPGGIRPAAAAVLGLHVVQAPLGAWNVALHAIGRRP